MKVPLRNPAWSRDELILALDLYFRHRPLQIDSSHPDITGLSSLLKRLRPQGENRVDANFRSPNSVYLKLCNLLRLDPAYKGKGLVHGAAEDTRVWNEFSEDLKRLKETAEAIRANALTDSTMIFREVPDSEEEEFPEGRLLFRAHRARERNRKLVKLAKARALRQSENLACAACGFDFEKKYGDLGKGYIECHHAVPVSQLTPSSKTKLKDIVLLCSNCHRIVHRRRPWLRVDELRRLFATNTH